MNQPLTPAQQQTLQQLNTRIDQFVSLGSTAALTATGVLNGAAAGSVVAGEFHRRFQRLGDCLRGLGAKVVVADQLPEPMGANTVITNGAQPAVRYLQLRSSLVRPGATALTPRALTLVHELSHALDEAGIHPVKDYAYRKGWAWHHLTPELAACNADSFAEAAAQLAEQAEQRPGRYQVAGLVPAQRDALHLASASTDLGAALAWVDLLVNRAWLRSDDSAGLAADEFRNGAWAAKEAEWRADANWAALLRIEESLTAKGLIGSRYAGLLNTGLDEADKLTVRRIHQALTSLKGALDTLVLDPVTVGATREVVYTPATRTLTVPHAVTGEGTVALGERILRALISGLTPPAAGTTGVDVRPQLRQVVDRLVANDRPRERFALQPLWAAFRDRPVTRTDPAAWRALALDLKRAVLANTAALWQTIAADAAELATQPADKRQALPDLHLALAEDLELAEAIGAQREPTRAEFTQLIAALDAIAAAVTPLHADRRETYRELRLRLAPFAV
ncbi:hypothetical protein [Streptomyces sp. TLI_171]|uniref:hypothetical protein n=1 Tax=Streptomyces sp. TLI_171 TaxID=1938859 RepID=UPI000C17AB11|nr:hypothetical protein [Streptomyces sp. TLI_171]RKE16951.1 hypothetical protein BX266_0199 [Streptomyces sp. TLI_171]